MPNWCHNVVTFRGTPEDCQAFRELMRADAGAFDFNGVVPMPPELKRCNVPDETAYEVKYGDWENDPWWGSKNYPSREAAMQAARHPENADRWHFGFVRPSGPEGGDISARAAHEPRTFDEAADMAHANVLAHGHVYWHGWAVEQWGTKWNVDDGEARWQSEPGVERVEFSTAWSPPGVVFARVAQRFPGADLEVEYREPMNGFHGRMAFANGVLADDFLGQITTDETEVEQ
jgi:hypothetical protein